MTIHLAADHAGFPMKQELLTFLRDELGFAVVDHGAHLYDAEDDFPDFVVPAAEAVAAAPDTNRAVILGGSGQGEAMAANRLTGVRAAVYYGGPQEIITLSRQHNHSNVLSLGARFLDVDEARSAVQLWLETDTSAEEKYHRRNDKFDGV